MILIEHILKIILKISELKVKIAFFFFDNRIGRDLIQNRQDFKAVLVTQVQS